MPNNQPKVSSFDKTRMFATSPAAVVIWVVNDEEKILFLSHPKREGFREVIAGALEAEESVWAGAMRELYEEVGEEIKVKSLGILHASTFRYDDNNQFMLSLDFLMKYEGGDIVPGDDMSGSGVHWMGLDELVEYEDKIYPPAHRPWIRERAIELFRLWKDRDISIEDMQPPGDLEQRIKRVK